MKPKSKQDLIRGQIRDKVLHRTNLIRHEYDLPELNDSQIFLAARAITLTLDETELLKKFLKEASK